MINFLLYCTNYDDLRVSISHETLKHSGAETIKNRSGCSVSTCFSLLTLSLKSLEKKARWTVIQCILIYEKMRKSDCENDSDFGFCIFGRSAAKQGQTHKLSQTE